MRNAMRPEFSMVTVLLAGLAAASPAVQAAAPAGEAMTVAHVQGSVWLVSAGEGKANVAVQVGSQGLLVVDTGERAGAPQLLEAIQGLARTAPGGPKPIRQVLNTTGAPDHSGGNEVIRRGGQAIVAGNMAFDNLGVTAGATVLANEGVLSRMVADKVEQPLWPTVTVDFPLYNMGFNGEAVQMIHPVAATTAGDAMVMFRRSDVLVTGDVVSMVSYPFIDVAHGGTIDGELVALNKLVDLAVPTGKAEGGTVIIPGHGRLCDQSDVVNYRTIITTIRNRVQFYKSQGKSLAQVLALAPSADYDNRWGAESGPWTTRQFIEAVYNTLPAKGPNFSMRSVTLVPATATVTGGKVY